jgi:hypothetical protein
VGVFPSALTKTAGHIDQVHGVHLLSDRLVALVTLGGEVDVQVPEHNG